MEKINRSTRKNKRTIHCREKNMYGQEENKNMKTRRGTQAIPQIHKQEAETQGKQLY